MLIASSGNLNSVFEELHTAAMQKLANNLSLALMLVLCCCGALLEAAPYPAELPSDPISYKREVRHRPLKNNPELEEYEVREIYIVRRPTKPPRVVKRLSSSQMNYRIRCDFEPTLPHCAQFATEPIINWRSSSSSSTSQKPKATATGSTTTATTTTTEATSTVSTSTSTDLPLLPELPQLETTTATTTKTTDVEDYGMGPDYNEDFDADDAEDNEDVADETDTEKDPEAEDYINAGGSIGGNDITK